MDKKTIIDKVKSLFAEAPEQVEETEVKYVDVKTEDNRILRMDDIAVDVAVEEITEDGEVQEIEDGSYVLEDGNTLVIAGGVITELQKLKKK